MPAVSVIVPTFQRRELVTRAVASVLAQTFRDFELLVVDDGSDDGTGDALAGIDERVRYQWQPNRGVAAARNAGIHLASGPIVAFLDSDNQWLPDHLEVITEVLSRHPRAVLASTCPRLLVAGRERPHDAREVDLLSQSVLGNYAGFVSCIAVRREALLAIGGFDEGLPVAEDNDLWLRLAMRGPFAMVRRRTIIQQTTRGGLKERGRRAGAYVAATDRYLARAVEELESLPSRNTDGLVRRARAGLALAAAARALGERDAAAVRAALDDACRLAPELSRDPGPVLQRLNSISPDRDAVLHAFSTAAELWPEQRTDTARFLRGYAAVVALRAGHLRRAMRLAAGCPFLLEPRFVRRSAPRVVRMARRRLHELRHPGRETAEVAPGP